MQAIIQSQLNDAGTTQDWDSDFLNDTLVYILDKDKLDADVTDKSVVFVIGQSIDSVSPLTHE